MAQQMSKEQAVRNQHRRAVKTTEAAAEPKAAEEVVYLFRFLQPCEVLVCGTSPDDAEDKFWKRKYAANAREVKSTEREILTVERTNWQTAAKECKT